MNAEKIRLPVIFGVCICLVFVLSACGRTDARDSGQTFLSEDEDQVSVADSSEAAEVFESVTGEFDEYYTYEGIGKAITIGMPRSGS